MKKFSVMSEAGQRIGIIKGKIMPLIKAGNTPLDVDKYTEQLILDYGDYPSFKTVANYQHATCININAGLVHGIPSSRAFKPKDVVTVDLGLVHDGYHVDTSFTVQISPQDSQTSHFLSVGQKALVAAIAQANPGNSIYQVSQAMQSAVESAGYSVVRDLTGHGVGRELHLPPAIFCYAHPATKKIIIQPNQTLAIEIMYCQGDYHLKTEADGWTISTKDGSLSGMFEETVYITKTGHQVLTTTIL